MIKVLRHSAVSILRHNNAQNDGGGRAYHSVFIHTGLPGLHPLHRKLPRTELVLNYVNIKKYYSV